MTAAQKAVFQKNDPRVDDLIDRMNKMEAKYNMLQVQHENLVSRTLNNGQAEYRPVPLAKDIGEGGVGDVYEHFPKTHADLVTMTIKELEDMAAFYGLTLTAKSKKEKIEQLLAFVCGTVPIEYFDDDE
eukprot:TRINITY_DN7120_c0_g1_i1.p1 TRINITY_DN7120_c0_g1~~TRINITY_DN7120_c0_g1_i1.p1  ORF type:complete len:129 (-),score=29.97 TRINITY_DN7120_c0_g1_i1:108-494(-)